MGDGGGGLELVNFFTNDPNLIKNAFFLGGGGEGRVGEVAGKGGPE